MDFVLFVFRFVFFYEKVHVVQFCADFSMKPKLLEQIHIATESFHYTLSENDIVYRGLDKHEILANKILKKILTLQKFNKILLLQTLMSPKQ